MNAPVSGSGGVQSVLWRPQPGPQMLLLQCPVEDVLYGGARGGGKTDGILADWLGHVRRNRDAARGVLFRRSYTPELEEIIRRSHEIYGPLGAKWHHRGVWNFGRATLRFRHLERDSDAESYQGHSYTWLGFDDVGTWPSATPINKLRATLRSAAGAKARMRSTANPGGPGHNWLKARYINGAIPCVPRWLLNDDEEGEAGGRTQVVYIPATLDDNPALLLNDPSYWQRVVAATAGNKALLRAWRFGDWDVVAGAYFSEVFDRQWHVLPRFEVPRGWRIFRSFDWGSSKPYSTAWWALCDGSDSVKIRGAEFCPPKDTIIRLTEDYGWNGKPNEGTRRTVRDIVKRMLEIEAARGWTGRVTSGVADRAIFTVANGQCIADDFKRLGIRWKPSAGGPGSRKNGWTKMRDRMVHSMQWPMEGPGLFFTEDCTEAIRTIPAIPRDKKDPDDIDTESEDHPADETRYAIMAVMDRSIRQVDSGI